MLHESANGGIPADLACSGAGEKGSLGLWIALDDEDEFWREVTCGSTRVTQKLDPHVASSGS
jgi:hypothetical protein